jgi:hypothetical protein
MKSDNCKVLQKMIQSEGFVTDNVLHGQWRIH